LKYREVFEKDRGFHLYRYKVSVLLHATAYSSRLTDDELSDYTAFIGKYLDDISEKPPRPIDYRPVPAVTLSDFAPLDNSPFYKFVSDETWRYIDSGNFQFGTAKYYRNTPNLHIKDEREGYANLHIGSGDDQLHLSVSTGENFAIFCGTSTNVESSERGMRRKFGDKIIKIADPKCFCERVRNLIGAKSYHIHDVIYSDLKNFIIEMDDIHDFVKITGNRDLTE